MTDLINILITILLSLCAFLSLRKQGLSAAFSYGAFFLTMSCLMDEIFFNIMSGIAGNTQAWSIRFFSVMTAKWMEVSFLVAGRGFFPGTDRTDFHTPDNVTAGFCLTVLFIVFFLRGRLVPKDAFIVEGVLLAAELFFIIGIRLYHRKNLKGLAMEQEQVRQLKQEQYLEGIKGQYERTRELWHDLKNHVNLMNMLLAEKKYEELGDYLKIFGEDVDGITLPVRTGSMIMDALLADKAAKARRQGIRVELSLCNLEGLSVLPNDLCSVFTNLLDNAIEACGGAGVKEPLIVILARDQAQEYYFSIRNTADREEVLSEGSSKADLKNRVGHGIGLRSVERVLHRNGGELASDFSGGMYTVVVRLPKITSDK